MRPENDRWWIGTGIPPHSVPQVMPDRKEQPEALLYDTKGKPLLVRSPRPLGFRPDRIKGER